MVLARSTSTATVQPSLATRPSHRNWRSVIPGPDVTSADEDLAARHHEFAGSLDPVDNIVKSLMGQYGPTSHVAEYLGVADGHWMTVPVCWGSAPLASCGLTQLPYLLRINEKHQAIGCLFQI
jgi:hypothetical protein